MKHWNERDVKEQQDKYWYERAVKERQEKKDKEEVTLFLAKKEVDEVTPESTSINKISKKTKTKN